MKALSIASLIALGISGAACSQDADATAEDTPPAETSSETADVGGSFNLGLPTEVDNSAATNAGEFNLALPGDAPASTDGFNLATDVSASSGLSELPEIETDIVQSEDAALSDVLETEPSDDEPVIRLD